MALREIVFDTETTGLSPLGGDRVVEIGCVELLNHVPTGATFHRYVNPERDMPEGAFAVHGLSSAFLADKPVFAAIADEFVAFIDGARLVAHNAAFDVAFLDAELARVGHPTIDPGRIVDTLQIARRKYPFSPNSLDALCQRLGIDNARRTKHGALLDSEILADVYVELLGGRQADLGLAAATPGRTSGSGFAVNRPMSRPVALPSRLTPADVAAHEAFVQSLSSAPIWRDYLPAGEPPREPS
jgi:DNA polymerase-3 subunit epsilon